MQGDRWRRVEKALRQLGVSKEMIWRVGEVREHLAAMSSMGVSVLPDFALHNHIHSDNVIFLLARLRSTFKFGLNECEAYLLALSAYLHDLGMFFSGERFRRNILPSPAQTLPTCPQNRCDRIENYKFEGKGIGEQIRETYNLLSGLMLEGPSIRSVVRPDDVPYLIAICRGHRKADLREQGCGCYRTELLGMDEIRVGLLVSLLRLADALDLHRNRAPKEVFEHRAPDFLNNPMALEHWLKHYFVTTPHITRQDQSGNVALVCTVNFRVPIKQINGEPYLDFFMPLFEEHVAELNRMDLDITQYPPVFTGALGITAMQADLAEGQQHGFPDLPEDIICEIEESRCKDVLDFLQWLQSEVGGFEAELESSKKPLDLMMSGPFCLGVLDQVEQFYDRDLEIHSALEWLGRSENVEVTGSRRVGKTWFLHYISDPATLQEYGRKHGMDPQRNILAYIDCQHDSIQQEESQVYKRLLDCIVNAAHQARIDFATKPCDGPVTRTAFEHALREMSRQGLRIILLLDEFEAMVRNPNLNVSFFSHLRALWMDRDIRVVYVTASDACLVDLLSEQQLSSAPFFDRFRPIRLGLFSEQDSRHLVEEAFRRAGTRFPAKLLELVLEVGGGHPFFLQMAGDRALGLMVAGEEPTADDRKTLLENLNDEATRHFKYYWKNLNEQEQYVLALLPLLWKRPECQEEIKNLTEQCLIVWRDGKYDYFSPLLEAFVRRQKVNDLFQVGLLLIDRRRRQVLLRGEALPLSPANYALLTCLVERAGQVVSNEELRQATWAGEPQSADQQLKLGIRSLREVLGRDADCIVDRRGAGYMFQFPLEFLRGGSLALLASN